MITSRLKETECSQPKGIRPVITSPSKKRATNCAHVSNWNWCQQVSKDRVETNSKPIRSTWYRNQSGVSSGSNSALSADTAVTGERERYKSDIRDYSTLILLIPNKNKFVGRYLETCSRDKGDATMVTLLFQTYKIIEWP